MATAPITPTPQTVEDLYQQYTGGAGDPEGLTFWKAGFGDTIDANEVASFQRSVAEARAQGTEPLTRAAQPAAQPAPLYQGLTATSTPEQIAAAYSQFTSGAGGDTVANQNTARTFLENRGIAAPVINQAYNQFTQPAAQTEPLTVEKLYEIYANRSSDPGGLEYWTKSFGDTIESGEVDAFKYAVAEARSKGTEAPAGTTPATPAPAPDYEQMVRDAYAGIGRTGIGEEAANIDQAGYDNWVNALKTGAVNPDDLSKTFKGAVADYLVANPEDKYSTYVTDYLQENKNPEIAGIQQLYQDVLGRDADASGLGTFYKQFGSEISPEERAQFEKSAQGELSTRVKNLYTDFLGREADEEGAKFWQQQFGSSIDDKEREQFRQSAAAEVNKQFGVTDPAAAPTTEGILSGFKYINDSGISEDKLKKTLGEDVFNTYKTGFSDYAKTGIANILADNKLSFDEASTAVKFGRDYGYDSQKLADLTGQRKELFDTINKTYDDTTNKIVDSVLGAEDAKTDGDKIARALALQQKYGFTDEDLAKATDFTPARIKEYLDPTRNYATAYKDTLSKPDVKGTDILKFLEDSRKNEGIGTVYGSNIDAQIAKINELNDKWKGYKVDGYQAENITNQVNQITKAANGKNWSGSWMGGGDNAMKEATAVLMRKGVDSLADLGVTQNYTKTGANVEFFNGQNVFKGEDGNKYISQLDQFGEYVSKPLPPNAKTIPGVMVEDYNSFSDSGPGITYRPLTEEELKTYDPKTGKFDMASGNKLIDKSTGKTISTSNDNRFVLDYYDTGNFFKGKDKTFGVMMTDQGVPVPYQTTEKTGLVYSPAFPILASMLLPGVGSAVSGMLPGAATAATATSAAVAPTLLNTALTQGILGGGMAALTGQDVLKGALLGGIGAPVSAGIGSLLPTGMDPSVAKAITSGGTGVVKGVLQGGDLEDLLGQGVLSGLTSYGLSEATKGFGNTLNLTPQQLNLAAGIAMPLLQGKDINPMNLIGPLAQMSQQQTTKATP